VLSAGTASAAATRVERRNWALRFVRFAMSRFPLAQALAAAASDAVPPLSPAAVTHQAADGTSGRRDV